MLSRKNVRRVVIGSIAGMTVAILAVYLLVVSKMPPSNLVTMWILAFSHPFLRLPAEGNMSIVIASVLLNGLYYAIVVTLAFLVHGSQVVRALFIVGVVVTVRFVMLMLFEIVLAIVTGQTVLAMTSV